MTEEEAKGSNGEERIVLSCCYVHRKRPGIAVMEDEADVHIALLIPNTQEEAAEVVVPASLQTALPAVHLVVVWQQTAAEELHQGCGRARTNRRRMTAALH